MDYNNQPNQPEENGVFSVLCAQLAAAGHKLTLPRKVMLEYFISAEPHKTAEDIYIDLRPRGLGRATVFRTLKLFLETGIAEKCSIGGKAGFELAPAEKDTHHHHMICVKCGRITEFFIPEMEELQAGEAARHGFKPLSHSFEIRGICADCDRNNTL